MAAPIRPPPSPADAIPDAGRLPHGFRPRALPEALSTTATRSRSRSRSVQHDPHRHHPGCRRTAQLHEDRPAHPCIRQAGRAGAPSTGRHRPAQRPGHEPHLLRGTGHPRTRHPPRSRRQHPRRGHRPGHGGHGTRTHRAPRPRRAGGGRCQLHAGRRHHRQEAAARAHPRRGRPAQRRPRHARRNQPAGHRRHHRPVLRHRALRPRGPAARGPPRRSHPLRRQRDDRQPLPPDPAPAGQPRQRRPGRRPACRTGQHALWRRHAAPPLQRRPSREAGRHGGRAAHAGQGPAAGLPGAPAHPRQPGKAPHRTRPEHPHHTAPVLHGIPQPLEGCADHPHRQWRPAGGIQRRGRALRHPA